MCCQRTAWIVRKLYGGRTLGMGMSSVTEPSVPKSSNMCLMSKERSATSRSALTALAQTIMKLGRGLRREAAHKDGASHCLKLRGWGGRHTDDHLDIVVGDKGNGGLSVSHCWRSSKVDGVCVEGWSRSWGSVVGKKMRVKDDTRSRRQVWG